MHQWEGYCALPLQTSQCYKYPILPQKWTVWSTTGKIIRTAISVTCAQP